MFLIASRPTGHVLYHFANKSLSRVESIIFFDCVSYCRTSSSRPINVCQEFAGTMFFHCGSSYRTSSFCPNMFVKSLKVWYVYCVTTYRTSCLLFCPINVCQEIEGTMFFHCGSSYRTSSFCPKECLTRVWKYEIFIASRPTGLPTGLLVYYFSPINVCQGFESLN